MIMHSILRMDINLFFPSVAFISLLKYLQTRVINVIIVQCLSLAHEQNLITCTFKLIELNAITSAR